jgi:hypothetical protein
LGGAVVGSVLAVGEEEEFGMEVEKGVVVFSAKESGGRTG